MNRLQGALEVWLKGDPKGLLGWLTGDGFEPFDHTKLKVTIAAVENEEDPDLAIDIEHHFVLTKRRLDIDHAITIHEGTGPGSRTYKNVPQGAKHVYNEFANHDQYTWKVLAVDMDEYEMLFDLEIFEPFEKRERPAAASLFDKPWHTGGVSSGPMPLRLADSSSEFILPKGDWPTALAGSKIEKSDHLGSFTITPRFDVEPETHLTATQVKLMQERMEQEIKMAMMMPNRLLHGH